MTLPASIVAIAIVSSEITRFRVPGAPPCYISVHGYRVQRPSLQCRLAGGEPGDEAMSLVKYKCMWHGGGTLEIDRSDHCAKSVSLLARGANIRKSQFSTVICMAWQDRAEHAGCSVDWLDALGCTQCLVCKYIFCFSTRGFFSLSVVLVTLCLT